MNRKHAIAATLVAGLLALDLITKRWALAALGDGRSRFLLEGWLGDGLPLTLAFNRGAAFSMHVGAASRWFFTIVSALALLLLAWMFVQARREDTLRLVSLSLVAAGAIGNLIDRLRWERGVVDFIGPVDLGFMRWPIFNVADSAVTVGAILLLLSLWQEDRAARAASLAAAGERTPAGG